MSNPSLLRLKFKSYSSQPFSYNLLRLLHHFPTFMYDYKVMYLTTVNSVFFRSGTRVITFSSSPCRATFASNGEITPPCGVPSFVAHQFLPSITPAVSQARICLRKIDEVFTFVNSASWPILSKHLAMSASRTHLAFLLIAEHIASIAS